MSRRDTSPTMPVFLSAVSDEFHKGDPEDPRGFQSYRDILARSLRLMDPRRYPVVVQEELAQGFGDLLTKLDEEIEHSAIVVHLVGNLAGFGPSAAELRRLRGRHPALLEHEPELAEAITDDAQISYTQWEIYLAFEHRCHHLVFVAEPHAVRSPRCIASEMEEPQKKHLARLRKTGEHRGPFEDQRDLAIKVMASIVRSGLDRMPGDAGPRAEAVAMARKDPEGLTRDIAEGIRKPDRPASPEIDPAGIEVFLRSVDSAALKRELDRRVALEIVADHREELRATADQQPTAESLRELALAELSMADYPAAMAAARRSAELAEALMTAEPTRAAQHREQALNSYLLLHDAAKAAGKGEEAVAALERGGSFIDRSREPVFWADYHEQLAEFHLDRAHWDRAEGIVDEIVDIREEHQPEGLAQAASLLFWCRLLDSKADYSGVVSVAARAERIIEMVVPPRLDGISSALSFRASALRELGRFGEAEPLFRRALAIWESSNGADHPSVAIGLNNLAVLLRETGRSAEAEPLFRRALAISESSYGADHPSVAVRLGNLAELLSETGRSAEAEPLFRRALAISESSYGADHPSVAVRLNSLAVLLRETGRSAKAEPLYRRALEIWESSYGADHPSVATGLNNLAVLLRETGRSAEAESLYRRALAILLRFGRDTGHEPPNLRAAIGNYRAFLGDSGHDEAAIRERLADIGRPFGCSFGDQDP